MSKVGEAYHPWDAGLRFKLAQEAAVTGSMTYRAEPDDARHGGLVIVADGAVTAGLRRVCDAFAEDGYETVAIAADGDLEGALAAVGEPRLLIGFGAGATRAWQAADGRYRVAAMALFHPEGLAPGKAPLPAIVHLGKADAGAWPDEQPVFGYEASAGFYLDDEAAHDPEAARLARLRTLALFRRTVARGEA